jgi:hypothetical protein
MKAWTKTHVDERCVSLGFANKHQLLHVEELLSVNGGYLLSGVSCMFISTLLYKYAPKVDKSSPWSR